MLLELIINTILTIIVIIIKLLGFVWLNHITGLSNESGSGKQ